jgi:hypothetical protein
MPLTSVKQRSANRANALKSTGPRTDQGKRRSSVNATVHRLSVAVNERDFAAEIAKISKIVRTDCASDVQAQELAKRIIAYERVQDYLIESDKKRANSGNRDSAAEHVQAELLEIVKTLRAKRSPKLTFTTDSKNLSRKERSQEIAFVEDFLKLQAAAQLSRIRGFERRETAQIRYLKRTSNQLSKYLLLIARVDLP